MQRSAASVSYIKIRLPFAGLPKPSLEVPLVADMSRALLSLCCISISPIHAGLDSLDPQVRDNARGDTIKPSYDNQPVGGAHSSSKMTAIQFIYEQVDHSLSAGQSAGLPEHFLQRHHTASTLASEIGCTCCRTAVKGLSGAWLPLEAKLVNA